MIDIYGSTYEDFHTTEELKRDLDIWSKKASAIEKQRIINVMIRTRNVQIARIENKLKTAISTSIAINKSKAGSADLKGIFNLLQELDQII